MDYRCVTELNELQEYIGDAKVIAFDFETAPIDKYRDEKFAALDAHKSVIAGVSFSVAEGTAVYVPLNHRVGDNAKNIEEITNWLSQTVFMNDKITKVAHNLSFETMFLYALGIIVQPPVYDTIVYH
ncbi:hypothetical protein [Dehalobacter sp.]|uniref:hypothetical protein n=1 Tax=Dehalobacter sp. TaxID=1962289 RepID=UPI002590D985|nr:hypothetical protein [Dehalobacter sp.]MDJ0304754.1 hypothetical protein [Dehalobacter sp.]